MTSGVPSLLVLSSEFPPGPGGIGTHAHQVSRHLHHLGWDVAVVSPQDYADPSDVAAFNATQPFRVYSVGNGGGRAVRSIRRAATTVSALKATSPDVMLASGAASVRTAACIPHRRPVVAVAHGPEVSPARPLPRRFARASFGRADLVVCVSDAVRQRFDALRATSASVAVIPNGGDESVFKPASADRTRAFRARMGIGDAPLLLTVGTIKERKAQDLVVRSLPLLVHQWDVHYAVIGPELRPGRLARIARDAGVAERVHLLGTYSRSDLVEAYSACDVFVLASRHTSAGDYEGFGIVAVEAALCERAAIVTDGSGLTDTVGPGDTALVVREDDATAVAEAVSSLLAAPDRRRAMGTAARRRALASQTWKHVAARYDAVLRELLTRKARCAS